MSEINGYENKILEGDCLEILKQIPDDSIDTIITSPPYYGQRDYGSSIGDQELGNEKTADEYVQNLLPIFIECVRVIKKSGNIFFNIGDKYEDSSLSLVPYLFAIAAKQIQHVKLINQITWVKPNPQPRQFQRRLVNSTEPIFHFVKSDTYAYYPDSFLEGQTLSRNNSKAKNGIGKSYFELIEKSDLDIKEKELAKNELSSVIDEVKLGKVWSFRMKIRGIHSAAYGGFEGGRKNHIKIKGFTIIRMYDRPLKRDVIETPILSLKYLKHPAIYPESLVQELISLTTQPNSIVLDPFLGSGTTAAVAKRMGRKFIGIELNRNYCVEARKRLSKTPVNSSL